MSVSEVRREVEAMRDLRASLGEIATRVDEGRRLDLVRLRRSFWTQLARLVAVCDPIFADRRATTLASDYHRQLSMLRIALALHQANWPAVSIDDDPVAYRASASVARSIENEFLAWIERVLDGLEAKGALPLPGA